MKSTPQEHHFDTSYLRFTMSNADLDESSNSRGQPPPPTFDAQQRASGASDANPKASNESSSFNDHFNESFPAYQGSSGTRKGVQNPPIPDPSNRYSRKILSFAEVITSADKVRSNRITSPLIKQSVPVAMVNMFNYLRNDKDINAPFYELSYDIVSNINKDNVEANGTIDPEQNEATVNLKSPLPSRKYLEKFHELKKLKLNELNDQATQSGKTGHIPDPLKFTSNKNPLDSVSYETMINSDNYGIDHPLTMLWCQYKAVKALEICQTSNESSERMVFFPTFSYFDTSMKPEIMGPFESDILSNWFKNLSGEIKIYGNYGHKFRFNLINGNNNNTDDMAIIKISYPNRFQNDIKIYEEAFQNVKFQPLLGPIPLNKSTSADDIQSVVVLVKFLNDQAPATRFRLDKHLVEVKILNRFTKCTGCNSTTHTKKNCTLQCSKCQDKGHLAAQCYTRASTIRNRFQSNQSSFNPHQNEHSENLGQDRSNSGQGSAEAFDNGSSNERDEAHHSTAAHDEDEMHSFTTPTKTSKRSNPKTSANITPKNAKSNLFNVLSDDDNDEEMISVDEDGEEVNIPHDEGDKSATHDSNEHTDSINKEGDLFETVDDNCQEQAPESQSSTYTTSETPVEASYEPNTSDEEETQEPFEDAFEDSSEAKETVEENEQDLTDEVDKSSTTQGQEKNKYEEVNQQNTTNEDTPQKVTTESNSDATIPELKRHRRKSSLSPSQMPEYKGSVSPKKKPNLFSRSRVGVDSGNTKGSLHLKPFTIFDHLKVFKYPFIENHDDWNELDSSLEPIRSELIEAISQDPLIIKKIISKGESSTEYKDLYTIQLEIVKSHLYNVIMSEILAYHNHKDFRLFREANTNLYYFEKIGDMILGMKNYIYIPDRLIEYASKDKQKFSALQEIFDQAETTNTPY